MLYVIAGLAYAFAVWLGYSFGFAAGFRKGGYTALDAFKRSDYGRE